MKINNVTNCYSIKAQNQDPLSIKNEINPIIGNNLCVSNFCKQQIPTKKPIKINISLLIYYFFSFSFKYYFFINFLLLLPQLTLSVSPSLIWRFWRTTSKPTTHSHLHCPPTPITTAQIHQICKKIISKTNQNHT